MELPITDITGSNDPYPTDAQLVAATLGGDRQALGHIYDRYSDRIYTMCVHMLGDRDEAADVCSEVFVVAFGRLDQLRDPPGCGRGCTRSAGTRCSGGPSA